MFKRLNIQLAGPICSCDTQDISWTPVVDDVSSPGLRCFKLDLCCKICKTKLSVSHEKFVASIVCEQPYPDGKKAQEDPVPKKKEDDKILN